MRLRRRPRHLPHCQPVQINWVGMPGPPSAGWRCVAECPIYRAQTARFTQAAHYWKRDSPR